MLALHRAGADQLITIPQVAAQDTHLVGGSKGAVEQATAMQWLQPLTVLDIGLASGNILGLPGIDQPHLKATAIQDLEGRNPVNARRFHGHRFDPAGFEPIGQGLQIDSKGAKSPHGSGVAVRRHGAQMLAVPDIDPGGIRMSHGQPGVEVDFCLLILLFFDWLRHNGWIGCVLTVEGPRPKSGINNAVF